MTTANPTRRGRPRDEDAEAAILEATLEILVEVGFAGLTIEAVAARAGVGKPTIYRRWAAKLDLVVAAVEASGSPLKAPETGDPKQDLQEIVVALIADVTASPLAYAQIALAADPKRHQELVDRLSGTIAHRQHAVIAVLDRAAKQKLIRDDVDSALVVELLLGPPLIHWLRTGQRIPAEQAKSMFETVWRGIAV